MADKLELSVEEGIQFAQQQAYWDGFIAGAQSAAEHAKKLAVRGILQSRKKENVIPIKENAGT